MKKNQKIIIAAGIAVFLLILAGIAGIAGVYFHSGKNQLLERVRCVNDLPMYQASGNAFEEDRINILLLGIDKEEEMSEPDDDGGSLGQADAIFVVSLDMEDNQVDILSIPRDTMVNIKMYDERGEYSGSLEAQLCLQYAYGDGQALSCQLMQEQVAELLNIPLHGYVALNLEMLPILNDAIGGVDITMDEDYTFINPAFEQGATLHLTGEEARDYLQIRDIEVAGSAYQRLSRHKQYIQAFYEKARTEIKDNPLIIFSLLQTLPDYMETDLEMNELASLILLGKECSFEEANIWVLEGEIVQGRIYEEYYVDQEKLEELVRELFGSGNSGDGT